ncbi:MAG: hypothetical protein V1767_05945 [Chloroflexota bacterium]
MVTKYTHLELNKDYSTGIAGYYSPEKEVRLRYDGREVLYVVGKAVIEATSSCCGGGSCPYAIVPGYVVNWQTTKSESGLPVSEIEPISDEHVQGDIKKIIESKEDLPLLAVGFW